MPRRFFPALPLLALCLGTSVRAAVTPAAVPGGMTLERDVKPLLEQYCFDCHNDQKTKGDVNLKEVSQGAALAEHREVWQKVIETMERGEMPPEKKPRPSEEERTRVLQFLDGQLSQLDCSLERSPGRVTVRRLNREEYRNTIRDLLQVEYEPTEFPLDDVGYGFDTIGDVLSLSPMLMEKYLAAAETIAARAIVTTSGGALTRRYPASKLQAKGDGAGPADGGQFIFTTNGTGGGEGWRNVQFATPGDYVLRLQASAEEATAAPLHLKVKVGPDEIDTVEVAAMPGQAATLEVPVHVEKAGWKDLSFTIMKEEEQANTAATAERHLYLDWFELQAPGGTAALPASHRAVITKMPEPGQERVTARELLWPLLERAYRRPVKRLEVERVAALFDLALKNQASFLEGMQVALQAVLCSPQFLFRWELDAGQVQPGKVRELNDFEVASRLSYFLWSSLPDAQLFNLARQGKLRAHLDEEIERMLQDGKSQRLIRNFAGQWLQIRNLNEISPDPAIFSRWSDDLRGLLREETERFFGAVVKEDHSVLDLVDADFTFVNEKLAAFYGLPSVKGDEFRRVSLPAASPRGGVLTLGAVLMATSTPTRTSPVIRGKWILEQILGTPPPSPPANVPPLNEQAQVNQSASLRERFSAHSQAAECAGCHQRMDPLGFALENFDAIGSWRERDGKFAIDSAGKLPDGRTFAGPKELKAILKASPQFPNTLTEKLLTYALGRGLDHQDRCAVDGILEELKQHEMKFSALVRGIVKSDPFLKRKAPDELSLN